MTSPRWQALTAAAKKAVDAYIADQMLRFGAVPTIPTNVILDLMKVPPSSLARKAVSQELLSRGWTSDQSTRHRVRSWRMRQEASA